MLSPAAKLKPHERIILAYDKNTFDQNDQHLLKALSGRIGMVKIGLQAMHARHESFGSVAFAVVHYCAMRGINVMWDVKLKDIKNTVVESIWSFKSWTKIPRIITVHATLPLDTLIAAVEAAREVDMLVAGVTLLTDHGEADSRQIYQDAPIGVVLGCAERLQEVANRTRLKVGMVCAPPDLEKIGEYGHEDLIKITPGVRGPKDAKDDQKRTLSAGEAVKAGANYLVIGRPIMKAADPAAAAGEIAEEISAATREIA